MDSIRIKGRRTWKRYSNGIGGDAITFLQTFEGKGFREAVEYLLDFNGRALVGAKSAHSVSAYGENCARSLAPPLPVRPASLGSYWVPRRPPCSAPGTAGSGWAASWRTQSWRRGPRSSSAPPRAGVTSWWTPMPCPRPGGGISPPNPGCPDSEAFGAIATEIARARFHDQGANPAYSREGYDLSTQSVSYVLCRRFGVERELPDLPARFQHLDVQQRRDVLGDIQDMTKKIGGSIERSILPPQRAAPAVHREER